MAGHGWGMRCHPESDTGIRRDYCGVNWPGGAPILSEKEQQMTSLDESDSPLARQCLDYPVDVMVPGIASKPV